MAKHRAHHPGKGRAKEVERGKGRSKAGRTPRRGKDEGAKLAVSSHLVEEAPSVLVVGDGDFSFTLGLALHRGNVGKGILSTSLDPKETVIEKYHGARKMLTQLEKKGVKVLHGIDATRLHSALLGHMVKGKFDRVIFNFPHTGQQRVHLNRNLLRDFFGSVRKVVKAAPLGGQVHVTLKDHSPYKGWDIDGMAREGGLIRMRRLRFDPGQFPGYRHKTTDPEAKAFNNARSFVHVFGRPMNAEGEEEEPEEPQELEEDVGEQEEEEEGPGNGEDSARRPLETALPEYARQTSSARCLIHQRLQATGWLWRRRKKLRY